jgi:fructose-1,6-bisphosphatase/inositol monophosphatase family enzyme
MTTSISLLKNGKVSTACFSNPVTKQVVIANKNSFGYNVICGSDSEFDKLAIGLKRNQNKSDYRTFSYSQKAVESLGFVLLVRGSEPNL